MWPFTTGKLMSQPSPPAGLEEFASYTTEPGAGESQAAGWYPGKLPEYDDGYFPTISDEDATLVHWDRPPADQNPQEWWAERTQWTQEQSQIEQIQSVPWNVDTGQTTRSQDSPYAIAPPVNRPTIQESPSDYRYLRPYGQDTERELNGVHMSLADQRIAYLIGQMAPPPSYGNSYRIDPPTNDATAFLATDDTGQSTLIKFSATETWPDSYTLNGSS